MMKSAGYYYRGGNLLFLTMFSMMCQKKTSLAFVTDRCWHHARCSSSMMIVRGGSISSSSSSSVAIEASTSTTTTTRRKRRSMLELEEQQEKQHPSELYFSHEGRELEL
mmetsp:Transcript_13915/g.15251  ORF Transcript_13915/g.15251 Transcript_13915/m.15251 type:complete len:109 (-) Transcript_13915:153-479(-)